MKTEQENKGFMGSWGVCFRESRMTHGVSRLTPHEYGFTLIELLVAVSILVIIGGASYTAFKMATDVYQKSGERMVMTQKSRIALDRVVTDLSNLQAVQGDQALLLISQDNPGEDGNERDLISFVTLIQTDPDPFLAQLNPPRESALATEEEGRVGLASDVQRVAYYIGEDPSRQEAESEARGAILRENSETTQNLALLRVATTALDPETVIQPLLESGTLSTEDEEGNPIYVDIVPIIDQIASFDAKYFDGEEWYDSWEDTERMPRSIQVWITVVAEGGGRGQNTPPDTLTQSTMVYLLMSASFSD